MWLLSFIPDSIIALFVHSVVALGAGLLVLGFLMARVLGTYATLARVFGVLILVAGIYFEGGLQNELHWRAEIEKQNAEIARLNEAAANITTQVETKYVDRIKIVKGKTNVIIEKIPEYITKNDDANCTIPDSFRVLYNAAAKNELPEATGKPDGATPSSAEGTGTK